jgi:hypothetical protein
MFAGAPEKELLQKAQNEPENFFKCNEKWPLCRFDLTKPHVMVDEFVFKIEDM